MNFPDGESEIVNRSGLQLNSSKNCCYCAKIELFTKKTVLLQDFFSSNLKSGRKNESLQDEVSDRKFSYQLIPRKDIKTYKC